MIQNVASFATTPRHCINYGNLLTYYATTGLRNNTNKIYCRQYLVYMLVKINKNHDILSEVDQKFSLRWDGAQRQYHYYNTNETQFLQ